MEEIKITVRSSKFIGTDCKKRKTIDKVLVTKAKISHFRPIR